MTASGFLVAVRGPRIAGVALFLPLLGGCDTPPAQTTHAAAKTGTATDTAPRRRIRATGTIQALRVHSVQAPYLAGSNVRMVLTGLIPNGARVKQGEVLAEFDITQQRDTGREAEAKYDDLGHQVEQHRAQFRSEAAKRLSELRQAEADLAKAEIEIRKGPILSEIDRSKAEVSVASARERVASLKRSSQYRDQAAAAAVRVLELQRDRQKVAVDRAKTNIEKMIVRAPLSGMVALENIWRAGSMGPPQEGDQMWPGQPLVRIFDPSEMVVVAAVSEPDGVALSRGGKAKVRVDAYPGLTVDAEFESASPVAAAALGSPIKTFAARFRISQTDPRLLPDLSAAVDVEVSGIAK